jgi:hypothetical protein
MSYALSSLTEGATVPSWLKALVMITGLGAWLLTVCVMLWRKQTPDAAILGIPAALVIALAPPFRITRGREEEEPADEPEQRVR